MKTIIFFALLFIAIHGFTQDPCLDKILSTRGSWGKISRTERVSAAELPLQRKFVNAFNADIEKNYKPRNIQIDRSVWHEPLDRSRPVASYGITLYGMQYSCSGTGVALQHETSTKAMIQINRFTDTELYEESNDTELTGFHRLTRGLPVEVKAGIWQFPDQRSSLGFGIDGNSKSWLITYDGKLPWKYVTRQEFLLKRKQILEAQRAKEGPHLKEQLEKWEMQRKYTEQQLKNDPQKYAAYINGTHTPAIEREKANHDRAMQDWNQSIELLDKQLRAPAAELNKQAIVVRSTENGRDYRFVETVVPLSEVLVRPNPEYFNKTLAQSVPQFINVEIIVNPKDRVASMFAQDTEAAIKLDYLKSFIGKSAPPASSEKLN
jgi:hypothetical protein